MVAAPSRTPILPDWCFCTSTIATSPAAEAPGRVRPCHPSPGKGSGWPGPDGSNVTLSDSDAIRVLFRALGARPDRSGDSEAEGRCGTGRAGHRDVTVAGRRSRPAAGRATEGTC